MWLVWRINEAICPIFTTDDAQQCRGWVITKLFNCNPFYLWTEGIGLNYIQNWITVKLERAPSWISAKNEKASVSIVPFRAIMQSLFSELEGTQSFKKQLSFLCFSYLFWTQQEKDWVVFIWRWDHVKIWHLWISTEKCCFSMFGKRFFQLQNETKYFWTFKFQQSRNTSEHYYERPSYHALITIDHGTVLTQLFSRRECF